MEKIVKISNLGEKIEFKMEKMIKISNLGRKREFKMEKIVKISNLRKRSEFKMEKMVKISNLRKKSEFKLEKIVEISILELGCKSPLTITISHNKKPPYSRKQFKNRNFREIDFVKSPKKLYKRCKKNLSSKMLPRFLV